MAVAIASSPLGLDAEPVGASTDGLVDSSVFNDADGNWIRAGPASSQSCRLLSRWVAKEAIGKASGLGLTPGEGWNPASDASGDPCWLTWLALPDAAAAAVATCHRQDHVWVRDAHDLGLSTR